MSPASLENRANLTGFASFCSHMGVGSAKSLIFHIARLSPPTRSSSGEPHDNVEEGRNLSVPKLCMRDHCWTVSARKHCFCRFIP
jgi:hypothetical protein